MNIVTHNLLAMNANRQLGITTKSKAKSTEKLSSGYRINRSADDAAGLAISEKMRRQIRGLTQGVENTQDGVSLCQVADGALAEVDEMLHRITELSVKSANGTNTDEDRQAIQQEINQILQEIDRIGDTTTFNEKNLFNNTDSINGGSSVDGGYTTIIEKNPNMLTEDQALQELRDRNFSIGNNDIEIAGGTISRETMNIVAYSLSSGILWHDYRNIQSGLSHRDEVDAIFNKIYDNFCITAPYENKIEQELGNDYMASEVDRQLELLRIYLDEAMNTSESDKNNLSDLSSRFQEQIGLETGRLPMWNCMELVKGAQYYYQGLGGVDAPGQYDHNSIGNKSMRYHLALLMEDLGDKWQNLPRVLKGEGGSDYFNVLGKYIAYANIQAGYDENGEKEVTVTVPGQPSNSDSLKLWIQSGAEAGQGMFLEIDRMNTNILGIEDLDASTVDGANDALDAVKGALQKVSANRSKIGAQQNRLEHTIANEENVVENTTAAESAIRDTDMAKEMVQFSMDNILEQVGQAMLAQANQSNQGVLSLLQ